MRNNPGIKKTTLGYSIDLIHCEINNNKFDFVSARPIVPLELMFMDPIFTLLLCKRHAGYCVIQ